MDDTYNSIPDRLEQLISACMKEGATGADARIGVSEGVSVAVREGKLESVERDESTGIALRCFFGQRQASVSGSDLSAGNISALAERCVAMAKAAPEDPYCGLPAAADVLSGDRDLDLRGDPEISPERLEADALEAEATALEIEHVKSIAGCGANWGQTRRWVAASNGFSSYKTGSSSSLGLAVIAENSDGMERDYESRTTRFLTDRPSAIEIGRTAAERAVARLSPTKVPSQTANVIFDRRVASSLLRPFVSAISGTSIARGTSFLKDRLGQQVFGADINIIDDPVRQMGMGSRKHDGEGRAVETTHLIENGVLKSWLLNGPSARQLGLTPNGFAGMGFGNPPGIATSNLYLQAGELSRDALMKQAGKGLLVSEMFGPSINPNTGDYSVGVSGYWFENGEIEKSVAEVTIAGDLPSMFARLIPANDLEFRGSTDAPSILIEDMSLAGA